MQQVPEVPVVDEVAHRSVDPGSEEVYSMASAVNAGVVREPRFKIRTGRVQRGRLSAVIRL